MKEIKTYRRCGVDVPYAVREEILLAAYSTVGSSIGTNPCRSYVKVPSLVVKLNISIVFRADTGGTAATETVTTDVTPQMFAGGDYCDLPNTRDDVATPFGFEVDTNADRYKLETTFNADSSFPTGRYILVAEWTLDPSTPAELGHKIAAECGAELDSPRPFVVGGSFS